MEDYESLLEKKQAVIDSKDIRKIYELWKKLETAEKEWETLPSSEEKACALQKINEAKNELANTGMSTLPILFKPY